MRRIATILLLLLSDFLVGPLAAFCAHLKWKALRADNNAHSAHVSFNTTKSPHFASSFQSNSTLLKSSIYNILNPRVFAHLATPLFGCLDSRRLQNRQQQKSLTLATAKMTKTALAIIADGSEDVEFIGPVDILRRAGVKVVVGSVGESLMVKTAQGVRIEADKKIKDISENEHFDVIVIPGGMKGAENCRDCPHLLKLLKAQQAAGRMIAAICASPVVVLTHHGFLDEVKAVAYPSFQSQLKHKGEGRVCVDKNFITSLAPGSSLEFGLEIVKCLLGEEKRADLAKALCVV